MKKLVCGCFGTIYYGKILKNGLMSSTDRVNVTDDAVAAVADHLMMQKEYADDKLAGYKFSTKDGGHVKLVLFDSDKYEIKEIVE